MTKNFFSDTLDVIEILYRDEIDKNFPNYAKFWEEFIGVDDKKQDVLWHYELVFDSELSEENKDDIRSKYEEMCIAHYSIFCHLAGAHYQIAQMKEHPQGNEETFLFFEAFENTYIHFGNVNNELDHFWKIICHFCGLQIQNSISFLCYIRTNGLSDLETQANQLHRDIITLRNTIVHFGRYAFRWHEGKYIIPFPIKEKTNWSELHREKGAVGCIWKANLDLSDIEKFINSLHTHAFTEMTNFFSNNNISLKRGN